MRSYRGAWGLLWGMRSYLGAWGIPWCMRFYSGSWGPTVGHEVLPCGMRSYSGTWGLPMWINAQHFFIEIVLPCITRNRYIDTTGTITFTYSSHTLLLSVSRGYCKQCCFAEDILYNCETQIWMCNRLGPDEHEDTPFHLATKMLIFRAWLVDKKDGRFAPLGLFAPSYSSLKTHFCPLLLYTYYTLFINVFDKM